MTGGSLPYIEVTFPESINIYLKIDIYYLYFLNLLTLDLLELPNQSELVAIIVLRIKVNFPTHHAIT
jgi:hypothetical protein